MIATIIIVTIAFVWLGIESRGLTVRLPSGKGTSSLPEYSDADFDEVIGDISLSELVGAYPEDYQETESGL